MADWSKPTLTDLYIDFMNYLKDRDIDASTLFLNNPTNPVVGMIRYNRTTDTLQEWNGTGWVDKVISQAGGGTGSISIGTVLGTMAMQNANAVNITGGSISGSLGIPLSSLGGIPANQLIGNPTGAAAIPSSFGLGPGLSFQSGVLNTTGGLPLSVCDGRLTLTSGKPAPSTDVTGSAVMYWTPVNGGDIGLYNGTNWVAFRPGELNINTSLYTASRPHDIFMDYNAGTPVLYALPWTSTTARATALAFQNGVPVLSGSPTKRYLGTAYFDGSKTVTSSRKVRGVANWYHKTRLVLATSEPTASWDLTPASAWRQQAGASGETTVSIMSPWSDADLGMPVSIDIKANDYWAASDSSNSSWLSNYAGIGRGSATNIAHTSPTGFYMVNASLWTMQMGSWAHLVEWIPIGYQTYMWSCYQLMGGGSWTVIRFYGNSTAGLLGTVIM